MREACLPEHFGQTRLSGLCAEHQAMWHAAYEYMERELMAEMEACATRHDHGDMTDLQWRSLVTHSVADRARELLGIRDLHPFWC